LRFQIFSLENNVVGEIVLPLWDSGRFSPGRVVSKMRAPICPIGNIGRNETGIGMRRGNIYKTA
jgi:hypothetical protein